MQRGLKLLAREDFPPLLNEIPQPPKQLWVRGNLPRSEDFKWLAVVGSRTMTSYGKRVCEKLIAGLAGYPIVIVSGLAYGVDAEAHRAALAGALTTVAVPGSGLDWDVLYPRANARLAREIIERGGALLSEFAPHTKAAPYTFPQRNRVMAGMCEATLVIEAKEKSGSLITARLATDYNRELLVVPGSIFSHESTGAHQFLKLGATPVTEPEDILRALGLETRVGASALARTDLSDAEIEILELLAVPLPRDELLEALQKPAAETNILLSMMELKGVIIEEFGLIRAS